MASSTLKITLVTATGAALCGLLAYAIKRYFQGAGGGSGHVADPQGAGRPVPLEEEKKRSIRPDSEQAQDIANHVADVPTLWTNPDYKGSPNPMVAPSGFVPRESCIPRGAFTLGDRQYRTVDELMHAERFKKAGPKEQLYFDPSEVRAAVVTCGGLCPGENVVIRELVMMLWYGYKVRSIYGVKYGFEGFWKNTAEGDCYVDLVPDLFPGMENRVRVLPVKDIHNTGGTVLGSSRGGFDGEKIVDALQRRGINQVYAIGGDGTHRGLLALSKIIRARGLQIALIGIPKTIDNDMPLLDKTFGFSSAVEMAVTAIQCADVEANGAEYGIGLVKVMGRNAGHIAMHAALANRDVNVCLIPEFPFDVYGPKGLFEYVVSRLRNRHHCVIVVSEGAGCGMRDVRLADLERRDNSGNRIPPVFPASSCRTSGPS
jgi:6-phosphofructokinase 1